MLKIHIVISEITKYRIFFLAFFQNKLLLGKGLDEICTSGRVMECVGFR